MSSGKSIENNLVVTATYPALQNAIQDFQRATNVMVEGSQIYGYHATLPNGSTFRFASFDTYQKAQGTTCTRLFVEEALNVDENIVTTLSMSAEKQIIFAYNPTKKSYLDKYLNVTKSNYIKTTYKDNQWLTNEQVSEFEHIRDQALKPTSSVLQRYAYQVYVLGEFSSMSGKVFKEIYNCTADDFDKIPAQLNFGIDFGFVDNGDMTTLVATKVHNNCLYARTLIYSNQLSRDYDLAWEMVKKGIMSSDVIYGDYGGMGRTRISNLISAGDYSWSESPINKGFNVCNCVKGKILNRIQRILQFDKIFVVVDDPLRDEMDGYELDENGKPKGTDHAIDSMAYSLSDYMANI